MQSPLIDVLVAVYNGEKYLPAFLESLLAQSFLDFRLIVSDNRSTDGTSAILGNYRGRFAQMEILPVPAKTVSAARNFARVAEYAGANYVMFADADDVWHADKIEKTLAKVRAAESEYGIESPILAHSDLRVVDRNLSPIHASYWAYQNIDPQRTHLTQLLLRNCVTGCTIMMNRALLELVRPIPDDVPMHDYWCALTAAALGNIVKIDEPLIEYRQHGGNDTGASSWGLAFVFNRARSLTDAQGLRASIGRKIIQSNLLLERYGERLAPHDRKLVQAFATLRQTNVIARRWRLLRFGFWDDGLVRNIGLFLGV